MMMSDYVHDVSEASRTVDYALGLAKRKLEAQFGEGNFTAADCIALAAITVTKLNMMHDCDMRYLEMDRQDRRATPSPVKKENIREQMMLNKGHGHVFPRADGAKTRCGGPKICRECGNDLIDKLNGN